MAAIAYDPFRWLVATKPRKIALACGTMIALLTLIL